MSTIHSAGRDRAIFLAVLTSLASKCGTLILRLVSIPIAIRALGMEEFGVYTAITALVAMVDTFHVGLGPALTKHLSKAVSDEDILTQKRVFATAMSLSVGLTTICSLIFATLFWTIPIPTIFGEKFAPHADTMKIAAFMALVIIAIEFIGIVMDRARDAYMETRITNLWGAGANLLGALSLLIGIRSFDNIFFLILAVNGSIALGKLGNAIHFFVKRPFHLHWLQFFHKPLVKPLMQSCIVLTVTYSLSALIEYSALGYLVGRSLGPATAGICALFVTIHVSVTGIVQMYTTPAWPALIDAKTRGDHEWVRKTRQRLYLITAFLGGGAIAGFALLGPWAIELWIGEPLAISRLGMVAFAVTLALSFWRHVNQVMLLAFDQDKWVAGMISMEAILSLAAIITVLSLSSDLTAVYLGIAVAIATVSGWLFPLKFSQSLEREPATQGLSKEFLPHK